MKKTIILTGIILLTNTISFAAHQSEIANPTTQQITQSTPSEKIKAIRKKRKIPTIPKTLTSVYTTSL